MAEERDLRHEAEATLLARQELGEELEPQLVDSFVDRIEEEIDRRAREEAAHRRPAKSHPAPMIPLALGSLGVAIPLIAIAGGIAKLPGIIAVCVAIVLVNLLWVTQR